MIKAKDNEYKVLKNEILDVKKTLELARKNNVKDLIYQREKLFDLNSGDDLFEIAFDGQEGEVLTFDFMCEIRPEFDYFLNVYFNNIKILSKKFSKICVINEKLYCVLLKNNLLKITLESSDNNEVFAQILCKGKMFNLPCCKNYLLASGTNNVINIIDNDRYCMLKYYANLENMFSGVVDKTENVSGEVLDSKLMNMQLESGVNEAFVYLNKLDGLFLCGDNKRLLISNENVSHATIIPVNHQLCSMIVAYVLNNEIKLAYVDKGFNLLKVENLKLKNITNIKCVNCATVDSENNKIVLMVIDGFDNCYLFGCFDYSEDASSLTLNVEPKLIGKGIFISGYVQNGKLICYLKDLSRCIIKCEFDLEKRGDGWYFVKTSTMKIANVNDVYILNGKQIYYKNGVIGELNFD